MIYHFKNDIMEDFFEEQELEQYKAQYDKKIQKGRDLIKSIGINYTKFKEILLMGVIGDVTEDWIVIMYNDYLFDVGRLSGAFTPVSWLSSYAAESWSKRKFEAAIKPLRDLALKNQRHYKK